MIVGIISVSNHYFN